MNKRVAVIYKPRRAGTTTYEKVRKHVIQTQKCTIGNIAKVFNLSLDDAARMTEWLQQAGVITQPINGVRQVLIKE